MIERVFTYSTTVAAGCSDEAKQVQVPNAIGVYWCKFRLVVLSTSSVI